MNHSAPRRHTPLWGLIALALLRVPAGADMAKVQLKDGTVMRGDVELTESEVLLRNLAGVVRCPRERVAHIEWLEPAGSVDSGAMRRVYALAPKDVGGHFALATWLAEQKAFGAARRRCEYVLAIDAGHHDAKALLQRINETSAGASADEPVGEDGAERDARQPARDRYQGVPPPPPLSAGDILKLKLSEVQLDGPAERLNVRFRKARGEPELEDLARKEMVDAFGYDPDWEDTLERGQAHEKLPVVLKATGLKYAGRIEIRGHPRVFSTYRRQVLPLVIKGCVRPGCHGGRTAQAFRFPTGVQSSDRFVYTSFVLLDRMHVAAGPMIDRGLPEESALLRYMLPAEQGRQVHPPVKQGRITPMLRGRRDPRYRTIVEWIDSLRSPHPDYQLEYEFPEWFEPLAQEQGEPLMLGEQPILVEPKEKATGDDTGQQEPIDRPDVAEKPDPSGDGDDEQP